MADLPAKPSLDHLRRQARDLLRAAQAGDTAAAGRIRAVSDALTLASAQLAVAREYGFASWTRLRDEVAARTASLAPSGRSVLRGQHPRRHRPGGPDAGGHPRARPLQLRHRGDPGRRRPRADRARPGSRPGHPGRHADGLDTAARGPRLAMAPARPGLGRGPAGRGPDAAGRRRRPQRPHRRGGRPRRLDPAALRGRRCGQPAHHRLLLERGAVPGDHDLYLAGFADDNHECLRLLLFHAADVAQLARMALAAPISLNDAEGVHLLLEAGADPNRYADDADPLSPVIYAAIRSGCSAELTGLLLGYGADPHIPGPDGRSPYVLAVTQGRTGSPCCCASTAPMSPSPAPTGCWPPARTRTGPRSSGCWPPTPRRRRGPRHHLGQHPDGVGRHRQRRTTRQPPPPRLDRHRASPARRGRLSPGHHPVTR